jgi:hypothetical protein
MGGRGEHPSNGAEFLGNEIGHIEQILALDHNGQIVAAAHQITLSHLVELGDATGQAIKTALALRGDLNLDQRSHTSLSGALAVHHGMIAEDQAVLLSLLDAGLHFLEAEAQNGGQLGGGALGVDGEELKQRVHEEGSLTVKHELADAASISCGASHRSLKYWGSSERGLQMRFTPSPSLRLCVATSLLICALCPAQQPAGKSKGIGNLDPAMGGKPQAGANVQWHDATQWGVEGRILPQAERKRWFDRLPASAEGKVTPAVWSLSRDSAGMVLRFRTNSPALHVHYKVNKANLGMPHMPATGVSGVDFYARDNNGQWKWVQVTRPGTQEVRAEVIRDLAPGEREYAAYLPLYNGVEFLKIGVEKGSSFEGLAPREKPILFYGTSITHGACASRPGMVHTAILGRRLDRPVVNLGFSGNGRMDQAVGEFIAQVDAACIVVDCLPNMQPSAVREKCVPLVRQLRAAHPKTPIILVEDRRFTNDWITPAKAKFHSDNHAALREAYDILKKEGVGDLDYIEGDHLYGDDTEGATDASHASDLGFMRQADIFEPVLRKALQGR